MAKILRKYQKIFGGSSAAAPSGIIAKFGSLAAASPAYSSDPDVIQALAAYLNGWQGAVVGNNSPALQDRNALDFLMTRQLAYLFQAGVAEWDASTEYETGSWVQVAGVVYISKVDTNVNNNPTTGSPYDTTHWLSLADQLSPLVGNNTSSPRAWVNFDGTQIPGNGGGSLTIRSSYGVSAVNKIAGSAAQYEVVFAGAFPDTTYAQFIQCGVAYNTLADYGRLSLKQNGSMRFKSLTTSSAEGQSSDCNVSIFSVNPLV